MMARAGLLGAQKPQKAHNPPPRGHTQNKAPDSRSRTHTKKGNAKTHAHAPTHTQTPPPSFPTQLAKRNKKKFRYRDFLVRLADCSNPSLLGSSARDAVKAKYDNLIALRDEGTYTSSDFFLQKNSGVALIGKTGVRTSGEIGVFCILYGREKKPARFFALAKVSSRARARCQAPSTPSCGRRHRLRTPLAARDAIDAARARLIDRQDSVVNAKTEGGLL